MSLNLQTQAETAVNLHIGTSTQAMGAAAKQSKYNPACAHIKHMCRAAGAQEASRTGHIMP